MLTEVEALKKMGEHGKIELPKVREKIYIARRLGRTVQYLWACPRCNLSAYKNSASIGFGCCVKTTRVYRYEDDPEDFMRY